MKRIGPFKPISHMTMLNWVGLPIIVAYVISMFVAPFFQEGYSWIELQKVWDRWQGMNVGMLAFLSSIVAFNISRYNAERQREREFRAARAALPASLSELSSYFKTCADILQVTWNQSKEARNNGIEKEINSLPAAPTIPKDYMHVFSNCIRHASPDVGDFMAQIMAKVQILDARLRDLSSMKRGVGAIDAHNTIANIYRLGELMSLVNQLYPFARNLDRFDHSRLDWGKLHSSFALLGIFEETIFISEQINLISYCKKKLEDVSLVEL